MTLEAIIMEAYGNDKKVTVTEFSVAPPEAPIQDQWEM
jgi:hypothetical protein